MAQYRKYPQAGIFLWLEKVGIVPAPLMLLSSRRYHFPFPDPVPVGKRIDIVDKAAACMPYRDMA